MEGVQTWIEGAQEWRREVTRELVALPRTLAQLREGVDNFQRVTKRLVEATESIEQLTQLQSGAVKAMRDQLASAPGGAVVAGALDDLTDALGSLARLNPFWPRVPPPAKPSD